MKTGAEEGLVLSASSVRMQMCDLTRDATLAFFLLGLEKKESNCHGARSQMCIFVWRWRKNREIDRFAPMQRVTASVGLFVFLEKKTKTGADADERKRYDAYD